MKVNIKTFVQDRWGAERDNEKVIEGFFVETEPFFLDGPVNRQVAVIDFDPVTGTVSPGAKFQPPGGNRKTGRYLIQDENDYSARDLNQVAAFGAIYQAMEMFRKPDALGRELSWAFGAPQLLVVPRAGQMANAFYERDSHSLQFFYFDHPRQPNQKVFTSQSRDIITHETGHAILDGIAPALYDAITPQSLALHEGVADLVATLAAFDSPNLRVRALRKSNGTLEASTDFSTLAEEFGSALDKTGLQGYLRNMFNQKTLDPNDQSLDPAGKPNRIRRTEPHELCQVLTGALYAVMINLHTAEKKAIAQARGISEFSASGEALAVRAGQFRRMLIRGLDYLPNGEISFADFGRAILASDQAAYPDSSAAREWLKDEFVRRKIVGDRTALEVQTNWGHPAVKVLNLRDLIESDWVAYEFANQNRELLHIPAGVTFKVAPRLDVSKEYTHRGRKETVRELLFKVSWYIPEPSELGRLFPRTRRIQVGATLAIDWKTRQVRAMLTSDHAGEDEGTEQRGDRSELLRQLAGEGLLRPATKIAGPDGADLGTVIPYVETEDIMRVRGTAKMLHIMERM